MNDVLTVLHQKIMEADTLVLVLVLAEGCDKEKSTLQHELELTLSQNNANVSLQVICFHEDSMVWPRPLTQTLYYFAPKNPNALFYRTGRIAVVNFLEDYKIAMEMTHGKSFEDVVYSDEEKELIQNTEDMLRTPVEMPSKFEMVRNFGKEMWSTAKRAGRGLPVIAETEKALDRYNICSDCEHFTQDARCTHCGCFMKAKINLEASKCPLGKW